MHRDFPQHWFHHRHILHPVQNLHKYLHKDLVNQSHHSPDRYHHLRFQYLLVKWMHHYHHSRYCHSSHHHHYPFLDHSPCSLYLVHRHHFENLFHHHHIPHLFQNYNGQHTVLVHLHHRSFDQCCL